MLPDFPNARCSVPSYSNDASASQTLACGAAMSRSIARPDSNAGATEVPAAFVQTFAPPLATAAPMSSSSPPVIPWSMGSSAPEIDATVASPRTSGFASRLSTYVTVASPDFATTSRRMTNLREFPSPERETMRPVHLPSHASVQSPGLESAKHLPLPLTFPADVTVMSCQVTRFVAPLPSVMSSSKPKSPTNHAGRGSTTSVNVETAVPTVSVTVNVPALDGAPAMRFSDALYVMPEGSPDTFSFIVSSRSSSDGRSPPSTPTVATYFSPGPLAIPPTKSPLASVKLSTTIENVFVTAFFTVAFVAFTVTG